MIRVRLRVCRARLVLLLFGGTKKARSAPRAASDNEFSLGIQWKRYRRRSDISNLKIALSIPNHEIQNLTLSFLGELEGMRTGPNNFLKNSCLLSVESK